MKKFLLLLFVILNYNSFVNSKETTFTNEIFKKAQMKGKTVVINSWNKTCYSCTKQVKILDEAKEDFVDILFLSFEQKKQNIAKLLGINYMGTIIVYKNNKELSRTIGESNREKIYSQIEASE